MFLTVVDKLKLHEVESQEIGKMSKTLHEVLHEVLKKCYFLYIINQGTRNRTPLLKNNEKFNCLEV